MHRYQDMLPAIALVFNQILFGAMYLRAMIKPYSIEGSWKSKDKLKQD
jgi:hypothetical protein